MQKANKLLLLLACVASFSLHAQVSASSTLSQAIETAKARKAIELNANVNIGEQNRTSEPSVKKSATVQLPKLWSIQGVGGALRAEVMYQGRMHEVSIANDAVQVGHWMLVGLTDQVAEFRLTGDGKKSTKNSAQTIRLKVPDRQNVTQIFPTTSGFGMQANAMPLPLGAAPVQAMRPPVPFDLLKP
jgi:hypothetical protein